MGVGGWGVGVVGGFGWVVEVVVGQPGRLSFFPVGVGGWC